MLNNILTISMLLSFITTLIVYFMINRNKDENTIGKSVSYFIFIFIIFIVVFYLIIYIYKINSSDLKDIIKTGSSVVESGLKKVPSVNNIFTDIPDF
jgi:ATP/ADP translocase